MKRHLEKDPAAKKRASNIRGIIVLVVLAALIVGYYFYLANHEREYSEDEVETTRVQEILLKDISKSYPATPKEVVKLYSDITLCFYDETYSEEELYDLAMMSHKLLDDELAKKNPEEEYYQNLVNEIADYKEKNYVISAYSTSSSIDIENEKFQSDGYSWTKVYCYYTIRRGTVITTIEEVFLLRKDESGYWKIYGWDLVEE